MLAGQEAVVPCTRSMRRMERSYGPIAWRTEIVARRQFHPGRFSFLTLVRSPMHFLPPLVSSYGTTPDPARVAEARRRSFTLENCMFVMRRVIPPPASHWTRLPAQISVSVSRLIRLLLS